MGVLGLWQILDSVGHPIKVEGLEGKRLGVDANVWLYKFIRGFREKDNATSLESHKLGLFNRISKLLFYKIKPVFVFDGPAPSLKRRTLNRRQNIRHKHLTKVQDAALKVLAEQLKKQYPDANIDEIKIQLPEFRSNGLVAAEKLTNDDLDLFYLPPNVREDSETSDSDDDVVTSVDRTKQFDHISGVDIHSKDFESLPPEVRYEILHDIKQSRRRIVNPESLPEDSNSFSNFQLERLRARRQIQEKIEKCEKDICSNYIGEFNEPSAVPGSHSIKAFRVQSDATSTMILRRNVSNTTINLDDTDEQIEEKSKQKEEKVELKEESKTDNPAVVEKFTNDYADVFSLPLSMRIEFEISDSDSDTATSSDMTGQHIPEVDVQAKDSLSEIESLPSGVHYDNLPGKKQSSTTTVNSESNPEESYSSSDSQHQINQPTKTCQPTQEVEECWKDICSNNMRERSGTSNMYPAEVIVTQSVIPHQNVSNTTIVLDDTTDEIEETAEQERETVDHGEMVSEQKQVTEPKEKTTVQKEASIEPKAATTQQISFQDHNFQPNYQELKQQQGPSIRAHNKVTTKIIEEAKELLRLFGIPYIDAAGEAEAQCALLEKLKLTEGTITDDSDVWLFGAQNVYRYFFSDDKYVMQYKMTDIEYHVRLTRENLVCFAMLVGSDYTDGIMNVGPVTALEILSEFSGDGLTPLIKFKQWRDSYLASKDSDRKLYHKKREKFLKFNLPDEFPSRLVFEGYMKPAADTSTEKFSWGTPELDELREYARRNFGWELKKIDDKLLPVMKKLSERRTQTTIDSFFFKTAANQNPEMFRSKRVNQALSKISRREAYQEVPEVVNLSEDDDDEGSGNCDTKKGEQKVPQSKKAVGIVRKKTTSQETRKKARTSAASSYKATDSRRQKP